MNNQEYDYEGYAIRYDVKQPDGRIVLKDAFKNCDGQTVPLVYNFYRNDGSHIPDTSPESILGMAYLENRDDGVYALCTLYDTPICTWIKKNGIDGCIKGLTVFARISESRVQDIVSGTIKAVKVVSH